jgi:hypothetical protein
MPSGAFASRHTWRHEMLCGRNISMALYFDWQIDTGKINIISGEGGMLRTVTRRPIPTRKKADINWRNVNVYLTLSCSYTALRKNFRSF